MKKKKVTYVSPNKPSVKFQAMLDKVSKAGTKKEAPTMKQYGDKGYKPSTGRGVGYKKHKESKRHEAKETKAHEMRESKSFEAKEEKGLVKDKKKWAKNTIRNFAKSKKSQPGDLIKKMRGKMC